MKIKELFEDNKFLQYKLKYNDGKVYKYYDKKEKAEEDFEKLKDKKIELFGMSHFSSKGFVWRKIK